MNARQLQSRLSSTRAVSPPPSQAASPSPCNHQSECYSGRQSMSGSTTYISPPASKLPTSAPRSSLRPIRSNKPSRVSYPSFPPRPFPLRHSFPAPAARRNSLPQAYSHGFPNLPDSPDSPDRPAHDADAPEVASPISAGSEARQTAAPQHESEWYIKLGTYARTTTPAGPAPPIPARWPDTLRDLQSKAP